MGRTAVTKVQAAILVVIIAVSAGTAGLVYLRGVGGAPTSTTSSTSSSSSTTAPHLEVDPPQVMIVPQEAIPFNVYLVGSGGSKTLLNSSQLTYAVDGASGSVNTTGGSAVANVFASGDVGKNGTLLVSYQGLQAQVPFSLISLSAADAQFIQGLNQGLQSAIGNYTSSVATFTSAAQSFDAANWQVGNDTSPSGLPFNAFEFNVTFDQLHPGTPVTIPLSQTRNLVGPITASQSFVAPIGANATFTLNTSNQQLGSSGLVQCYKPNKCYSVTTTIRLTLENLTRSDTSYTHVETHPLFDGASLGAISASYIDSSNRAHVIYTSYMPIWCAIVYDKLAEIDSLTKCGSNEPVVTSVPSDGSKLTWILNDTTYPREDTLMKTMVTIGFEEYVSSFSDMASADAAAQNQYEGMLRAQVQLAQMKAQALQELAQRQASATGYVRQFWTDNLQKIVDGIGNFTENLASSLGSIPGLPQGTKDAINGLKDGFDKGKNLASLFLLLAKSDDPTLTDKQRILAVKQAFDIGRALGPGGPFAKALFPFFEFYSQALEAVANALEVIDNLRKAQVLSTGDCSIIAALIADPQRVKAWTDACTLHQLLQRIRDP